MHCVPPMQTVHEAPHAELSSLAPHRVPVAHLKRPPLHVKSHALSSQIAAPLAGAGQSVQLDPH
jgi:hypothetical protein